MDKSDLLSMLDIESRPTKGRTSKRKWREIEVIKDKYQLRKELEEMDISLEHELDQLNF